MRVQTPGFQACDVVQTAAVRWREAGGGAVRVCQMGRWLCAALFVTAALISQSPTVRAQQTVPCPPEQQELVRIPEVAAQNNILSGAVTLSDEIEAMPSRQPPQMLPGDPNSKIVCQGQRVRILRAGTTAAPQPSPGGLLPNPMPGPTLRARVGDIINLTFLNQVNPSNFSASIDNGERGLGCDKPVPPGDKFPDCFHGSSTGNIHFHGTHTNPNNTGDNVFIEVRPLPRNNQGNLTTTPQQIQEDLDKFYAQCTQRLKPSPLVVWPKTWADMPSDWANQQKTLIQAYDKKMREDYGPNAQAFWPINAQQIAEGAWPQFYIGAFPYCYRLPSYPSAGAPAPVGPAGHTMHMAMPQEPRGGAGTAELNSKGIMTPEQEGVGPSLIMGQSPGTHWYHAHKHGSTAINVANGMTGAFIIEGSYDDDINAFYGANWTRTQPLMIINQLGVTPNLMRGGTNNQQGGITATDKGPDFTVNGQVKPVVTMQPGEVQMWRIVNTSGRAGAFFNAPDASKFEWRQLAQDGVQFNDYNYQHRNKNKTFLLAAGNRADLLVQAKPCPGGAATCSYPVIVQNEVDPADLSKALPITLLTINVAGTPVTPNSTPGSAAGVFMPTAPTFPAFLDDIKDAEVTGTKIITFASTPPGLPAVPGSGTPPMAAQHTINHQKFDGEVGALVQLNKVEEWKIVNESYGPLISHPFHIHINPFQVTEIFNPNAKATVTYTNPKTRQPVIDPKTKKPITATVSQYVYDAKALYTSTTYPVFQAQVRAQQCLLNPQAPDSWKPCAHEPPNVNNIWWDVFPIPSGASATDAQGNPINNAQGQQVQVPGYFKMRSRFVDYSGYYVIHCHILAHEDRGMMTVVEVAPATTPYSHN
ncbi:MAG: hypothetical protein QOH49_387 [Acidobacteriota bacterium]|nr:hypothetical protein [Acidobacteriota bacterium]